MSPEAAPQPRLPDVSRLFSDAWTLYRSRLLLLLAIGAVGGLASLASLALPAALLLLSPWRSPWAWTAAILAWLSGALWIFSWWQVACLEAVMRPAAPGGVVAFYRESWPKVSGFSWVCVLYALVTMGGACLLVLPGIYLGIAFLFSPLIYLDEGVGGFAALQRSLEYTWGRWWAVFGRLVLAGAATSLPGVVPVVGPVLGGVAAPFGLANAVVLYGEIKELHRATAAGPSGMSKAIMLAALCGLAFPVWTAIRVVPMLPRLLPAAKAELLFFRDHPVDPAALQKLIPLLESGSTLESVTQAFQIANSSSAAEAPR